MASAVYDVCKEKLLVGAIDVVDDAIIVGLFASTLTVDSTDTDYDNTHELATGSGYTRGNETLANGAVLTANAPVIAFNGDDPQWTSATFTARYAVLYDTTIHATTNNLLCVIDFGADKSVSAGTFTIQFHATVIITFT